VVVVSACFGGYSYAALSEQVYEKELQVVWSLSPHASAVIHMRLFQSKSMKNVVASISLRVLKSNHKSS
jgi:hypothetical protein